MRTFFFSAALLSCALALPTPNVRAAEAKKPVARRSQTEADNTAENVRDRSGETRTPLDQSTKSEDLKLTQEIRKVMVAGDGLSFDAKNVKINTGAGQVTPRGPVDGGAEKTKVAEHAKKCTGKVPVVNQLEVKSMPRK